MQLVLYRAAWHQVLWQRTGLPDWETFEAEIRGEAPPRKTAKQLLRVAEGIVKVLRGGRDLRKKPAAASPAAVPEEAARG